MEEGKDWHRVHLMAAQLNISLTCNCVFVVPVARPLSMPPKPKKTRLKAAAQPKLFEGSLAEYIEVGIHALVTVLLRLEESIILVVPQ